MDKRVKKGIDIGAIILVVIIFILGAAILSLTITKKTDGVPRVFGVTFLDIQTESMRGTIDAGDVAVITKVKKASDLKVGDIITFWDFMDIDGNGTTERILNTHRITEIIGTETLQFKTKGDNTPGEDYSAKTFEEVVGRYQFRLPNVGYFVRFLQSVWGFLLVVILPLSAFLVYRIYVLVKVVMQIKKEKLAKEGNDPESLKAELAELKAKLASQVPQAPPAEPAEQKKE